MPAIEQLIVILFAYILLYLGLNHLLDYWWNSEDDEDVTVTPIPRTQTSAPDDTIVDDSAHSSTIVCHVCQTENQSEYTYCKNCVIKLKGW